MPDDLPFVKPEDYQYFAKLLDEKQDDELSVEEAKERKIMRLMLKIKNGTPPMRKVALRQITDKAREFGPGPLFNQILPLLMSPSVRAASRVHARQKKKRARAPYFFPDVPCVGRPWRIVGGGVREIARAALGISCAATAGGPGAPSHGQGHRSHFVQAR